MRVYLVACFCFGLFLTHSGAQQELTLADVLLGENIPPLPITIPDLHSEITSYATLNDDKEFVVGYYLLDPAERNALKTPLLITRFDKQTNEWSHVALSGVKVKALEGHDIESDCLGSVSAIERHNGNYYLNLHLTPSASCTLILNRDLTVSHTLGGWTDAFFESGRVIYTGNMVHFAPTHPEKLYIYDPVVHDSRLLYPQREDPLRNMFIARIRKVFDQDRCGKDNWACDPKEFESIVTPPIKVSDATNSLAFRVEFSPRGFLSSAEAEDGGQWEDDEYVYVYELNPFRWREFSVYDLKPKFGTDSLEKLLAPETLSRVFATPRP
ncbi:MAG: hypothetical protein JOZ80_17140 [Acidobacteriaceae bacterium]|nr:hypothetical protein [Acidobacteriaceae bacterium]